MAAGDSPIQARGILPSEMERGWPHRPQEGKGTPQLQRCHTKL